MKKRYLVTGGAGFIGSAFIRALLKSKTTCDKIVNLDLLTYAASLDNLAEIEKDSRYTFVRGDICDESLVRSLCKEHAIDTIVHFAAESHVDRSIEDPRLFYKTNIEGTICLLEVVRTIPSIHFHHISTDEVYGSIADGGCFSESSLYHPNSPYAASKAASDHFVRAYAHTYGLSTTLSHSSNNYGPCQFEEKFIPRMILHCVKREPLPVYGQGINIRDWLYVEDHVEAILSILQKGRKAETYNIGASCEKRNIDLLHLLIQELAFQTDVDVQEYHSLIQFVSDRPGHDLRYAIDSRKIREELGWTPRVDLTSGLKKTISWYLKKFSIVGCL
jgi:dTDP-glucose 4,6-dehydratase